MEKNNGVVKKKGVKQPLLQLLNKLMNRQFDAGVFRCGSEVGRLSF